MDVVVPWRPGCPHRQAALDWLTARTPNLIVGRHDHGPWVKALAVDDALRTSTADTIAIHDADVWTDGLADAVQAVQNGAPWAVPHLHVHRLDQPSTAAVLAGGPLEGTCVERPYRGWLGGGIVVLPRATYEQVPLDPRFAGWGQEDESWALGLIHLIGQPWRGTADLWHLWHPPQDRLNRSYGSAEGQALNDRYRRARRSKDRMREIVEEARECRRSSSRATAPASPLS